MGQAAHAAWGGLHGGSTAAGGAFHLFESPLKDLWRSLAHRGEERRLLPMPTAVGHEALDEPQPHRAHHAQKSRGLPHGDGLAPAAQALVPGLSQHTAAAAAAAEAFALCFTALSRHHTGCCAAFHSVSQRFTTCKRLGHHVAKMQNSLRGKKKGD